MPKIYLKHALRAQIIGLNIDLEHFAHLSSNFYRASKNEKICFFFGRSDFEIEQHIGCL